jgi:putative transposase
LTDAQWTLVEPLLPPVPWTGRKRIVDLRGIIAGINYHWRTGCAWRKLPPGFPPWSTVYTYYRRWVKDGTLRDLRAILEPPKPSEVMPRKVPPRPHPKLNPDRGPPGVRKPPPKPR